VREVHQALSADEDCAFTTVQTLLRIMEDKVLVQHHLDGRSFIYTARFSRDESARRFLDRVFDGAASQFVSCLLRAESIPDEELDRMQAMIREARRARGGRP
jgi:predicted transcriptional regulator